MNTPTPRQVPEIKTSRLWLRALSINDRMDILAIHSDAETLKYWGHDAISQPAEAEEIIRLNIHSVESGASICWGIEEKKSKQLIGTCTLFKFDDQNRRAELGYILNRQFWGQGIMSEALSTVIHHAFEDLNLHRLEADTDPDNKPSLALLRKFGFKSEGLFRDRWLVHGKWHDSEMLGLLQSDYSIHHKF